MISIYCILLLIGYMFLSNIISYRLMKKRVLESQVWDLNICCGKTDGGGVNADIVKHSSVPNFVIVDDIYNLPFRNKYFGTVLCSHTIEHVEDPEKFYHELVRIGKRVKIVVPPLWDVTAALNILEHKWIFITLKKEHSTLPYFIKLPFSNLIQKIFGQRIKA